MGGAGGGGGDTGGPRAKMAACGHGGPRAPGRRRRGCRRGGDKWRFGGNARMRAASKPDVSQVRRIVREGEGRGAQRRDRGGDARGCAHGAAPVGQVRRLQPGNIECPARTGGPQDGLPGRRGHGAVAGGGAAKLPIEGPSRTGHASRIALPPLGVAPRQRPRPCIGGSIQNSIRWPRLNRRRTPRLRVLERAWLETPPGRQEHSWRVLSFRA